MLHSGTDPASYITEYTSVYEETSAGFVPVCSVSHQFGDPRARQSWQNRTTNPACPLQQVAVNPTGAELQFRGLSSRVLESGMRF